jgi:predicted nuclease of predicted toxin-antitoxin system
VKLLFDQNLSLRLVGRLADLYPGSSHLHVLGLDRAADGEVYGHARREGFAIVTKDADFSDLCLLQGFPPNVVWIRRGNCTTAEIEQMLRAHQSDVESLIEDPFLGVLTLL